MATVKMSDTLRTARATAIVTAAGTTPFLNIYSGSMPASPATVVSTGLLASLPCSNPLGTVTTGVLTFSTVTTTNAVGSGTAGFARLCVATNSTTSVMDFDVSTVSDGTGAIQLNTTTIVADGPVVVSSAATTEPA